MSGSNADAAPASARDVARHWRAVADAVARNLAGVPVKAADFLELVDAIVADALPAGADDEKIDDAVRRYLMALSLKSLTPS